MTARQRIARRIVLGVLAHLRDGQLTIVEDQEPLTLGQGSPRATVEICSPRVWPMLLHGSRGMAEAYMEGHWVSPDLTALVRVAARNVTALDAWRRRLAPARIPLQTARGIRARNTRLRSRRSIAAHYDLGNEFFALMLDETMMYSSAYFPRRGMTLAQASSAKLELVCDQLELHADDHVLEIGAGWGGFAVHAARTRGCRVTTTTISREQYEYARAQVRAAGVDDRVTVLLEDYRDLSGSYDKLVSIEMIEAVGWRDFDTFFERCSQRLTAGGAMLLQAIVIDDRAYAVEKSSRSFIRTHIFPNGCLPSLEVIARCVARRTDLRTVGLLDLTPHYAETLRRWRANFGGRRDAAGGPWLRRSFSPAVAHVPRILRGGLHRAADRRCADPIGEASMAQRHRPHEAAVAGAGVLVASSSEPALEPLASGFRAARLTRARASNGFLSRGNSLQRRTFARRGDVCLATRAPHDG